MALQGDLSDLPLIDLMQVLTVQRRSGILTLVQSFSQAQVAFTQSRVYSAFLWRVTTQGREVQFEGVPALHELMTWGDGQFTFEVTNLLPPVENVKVPFEAFVKEHYKLGEQQNLLEEETSWLTLCPELVDQPPDYDGINLSMDELRVLRLINGILTIGDIAEMVRVDVNRVINITRDLERRGLLTIPRKAAVQPLALPGTYLEYRQNRKAAATQPKLLSTQTAQVAYAAEPVSAKPEITAEIPGGQIKPVTPFDNEPAKIKAAPTVKLSPDFPSFNTIEAVLDALPMGPSWLGSSAPQAQSQPLPVVPAPQFADFGAAFGTIPTSPAPRREIEPPSLDLFNLPLEADGPITTPSRPIPPVVERFVPSPAPKTPSRLQSVTPRWEEKAPVEESLRPKVKRSLLGTIMAKIRGL